jgi:hypothetical protein
VTVPTLRNRNLGTQLTLESGRASLPGPQAPSFPSKPRVPWGLFSQDSNVRRDRAPALPTALDGPGNGGMFLIEDANGQPLASLYFADGASRQNGIKEAHQARK